jgi:hypothetical protein
MVSGLNIINMECITEMMRFKAVTLAQQTGGQAVLHSKKRRRNERRRDGKEESS